jgi:hypothetical protein
MIANPKPALHNLIEQLSDDDAATALAYIEQLIALPSLIPLAPDGGPLMPHEPPVLHRAPAIVDIDELRADVFPPQESTDEFDATIRVWRQYGQPEHE